jgi:uncharacterized membrane protein
MVEMVDNLFLDCNYSGVFGILFGIGLTLPWLIHLNYWTTFNLVRLVDLATVYAHFHMSFGFRKFE